MTSSDLTRPAGKAQQQAKNALQEIFSTRPRDEWLSILDRAGVPAGKVLSIAEVMQDPELVRRLNRFELDDGPSRTDRDVLSWLGYKPKEIDALTTRATGGSSPGQG
jgi:crotonobetainyl-CoA:carnitine CoA-transferase CaiB-like acyl-CoA transferase